MYSRLLALYDGVNLTFEKEGKMLQERINVFLQALDDGYQQKMLEPMFNTSLLCKDGVYYGCGVVSASLSRRSANAMALADLLHLSLHVIVLRATIDFNLPRAFLWGFIHGFDANENTPWSYESNPLYKLGYDHGYKKHQQYFLNV
jgi:hypothetical protein